jgi:hypothetical protein
MGGAIVHDVAAALDFVFALGQLTCVLALSHVARAVHAECIPGRSER